MVNPPTVGLLMATLTTTSAIRTPRHLQDVTPSSSHNIRFSQCIDIKLRDDDLFADEYIASVQNGEIVSTKSYVLFHLCQRDECFYEAEDDLFLVDLRTYLENVAVYRAEERGEYCNACGDFVDYCLGGDDAVDYDGGGADDAMEEEDDQVADEVQDDGQVEEEAEQVEEEVQEEGNGECIYFNTGSMHCNLSN